MKPLQLTPHQKAALRGKRPGLKKPLPRSVPCVPLTALEIVTARETPATSSLVDRFAKWVRGVGAKLMNFRRPAR